MFSPLRLALAGMLGWTLLATATLARADEPRANATVKANRKAQPSVVAIKVPGASAATKGMVGSGIIIDERGYIVTNRHVIAGCKQISVVFVDKSETPATVLVADPNTDLAVLKVDVDRKLPALALAPVSDLEVGEDVIAIGHPYGYDYTLSKGIVSALNRRIDLPNGVALTGLIQTTAPINPGNSGGPLLNINGEFIGINTALRDGAQNIAFAVTTDTLKRVLAEKLSALKVAGVSHGIYAKEAVIAQTGDRQQLIVAGVADQGLAAGIKQGDQIRMVGTVQVKNSFDLERAFWDARPGQQVAVAIVRDGQEMQVTLTLSSTQGTAVVSANAGLGSR